MRGVYKGILDGILGWEMTCLPLGIVLAWKFGRLLLTAGACVHAVGLWFVCGWVVYLYVILVVYGMVFGICTCLCCTDMWSAYVVLRVYFFFSRFYLLILEFSGVFRFINE